jgi:diadenosine tetraphosphate (Ap4A) HIT family hydrolase
MDLQRDWPEDWAARMAGENCVMCRSIERHEAKDMLVLGDLSHSQVWLHRRSALMGYCVVPWAGPHVSEASELSEGDASAFWADVLAVSRAIEQTFQPMKMNLLFLGNREPHLHAHVVPRYKHDPAPGGPVAWADMFRDAARSVESLQDQAKAISRHLSLKQRPPSAL